MMTMDSQAMQGCVAGSTCRVNPAALTTENSAAAVTAMQPHKQVLPIVIGAGIGIGEVVGYVAAGATLGAAIGMAWHHISSQASAGLDSLLGGSQVHNIVDPVNPAGANPKVEEGAKAATGTESVDPESEAERVLPNPTDPEVLRGRQAYNGEVAGLDQEESRMRADGQSDEEIARALHQQRRDIGERYKNLTPEPLLDEIYRRNLQKYGDRLGPSVDWLRSDKNLDGSPKVPKSWGDIIESSKRTSGKELGFKGNK